MIKKVTAAEYKPCRPPAWRANKRLSFRKRNAQRSWWKCENRAAIIKRALALQRSVQWLIMVALC